MYTYIDHIKPTTILTTIYSFERDEMLNTCLMFVSKFPIRRVNYLQGRRHREMQLMLLKF